MASSSTAPRRVPLAILFRTARWLLPALSLSAAAGSALASAPENGDDACTSFQAEAQALPDSAAAAAVSTETEGLATLVMSPDDLESTLQGRKIVLDWTVAEANPARFRILHPDGRVIATRDGRRSVQGWIASVRVAGWPQGLYLITAEAGALKSARKFILR